MDAAVCELRGASDAPPTLLVDSGQRQHPDDFLPGPLDGGQGYARSSVLVLFFWSYALPVLLVLAGLGVYFAARRRRRRLQKARRAVDGTTPH